jgi:hypothetical protein
VLGDEIALLQDREPLADQPVRPDPLAERERHLVHRPGHLELYVDRAISKPSMSTSRRARSNILNVIAQKILPGTDGLLRVPKSSSGKSRPLVPRRATLEGILWGRCRDRCSFAATGSMFAVIRASRVSSETSRRQRVTPGRVNQSPRQGRGRPLMADFPGPGRNQT